MTYLFPRTHPTHVTGLKNTIKQVPIGCVVRFKIRAFIKAILKQIFHFIQSLSVCGDLKYKSIIINDDRMLASSWAKFSRVSVYAFVTLMYSNATVCVCVCMSERESLRGFIRARVCAVQILRCVMPKW